jgi:hypothetical protein
LKPDAISLIDKFYEIVPPLMNLQSQAETSHLLGRCLVSMVEHLPWKLAMMLCHCIFACFDPTNERPVDKVLSSQLYHLMGSPRPLSVVSRLAIIQALGWNMRNICQLPLPTSLKRWLRGFDYAIMDEREFCLHL